MSDQAYRSPISRLLGYEEHTSALGVAMELTVVACALALLAFLASLPLLFVAMMV
jgi:hypothetical protein